MNLLELKQILKENNLTTRKSLDQHFLYDDSILNREVEYAEVTELDNVLEIGPGIGTLTKAIVEKAGSTTVIELDQSFRKVLEIIPGVSIIIGDALEVDWKNLSENYEAPHFNKIISNVPYSISSPLIFKILEYGPALSVLCLQKEFAERMVAKPKTKNYSRLTVNCSVRADVELLETISKEEYYPIPKVDSAIVKLIPKKVELPEKFDSIVRAAFQHKNQKLKKALMHSHHEIGEKDEVQKFVDNLGEIGEIKVFEISPEEFVRISKKY
jgi:16S rRNA (adenine1518-N6/adenine1519-N6)-dimethyltransferase